MPKRQPPDIGDRPEDAAATALEALVQNRLASTPPQSLLEISLHPAPFIERHCQKHQIHYQHCSPNDCSNLSTRFDLALVHQLETLPIHEMRTCIGLLRNLLSERVWILVEQEYCSNEEWISLGFKRDSLPSEVASHTASFSYNLQTYNYKRDWNNTRFWANPDSWNKRF